MNKQELVILTKALKVIIKEEVARQVKRETQTIRESLLKEMKSKNVSNVVEKDPLDIEHVFENKKHNFSTNNILNDMLNETANQDEWKTMEFNSRSVSGFNTQRMVGISGDLQRNSAAPQVDSDGRPVNQQLLQSSGLDKVFTRDYSALMKHPKMRGN